MHIIGGLVFVVGFVFGSAGYTYIGFGLVLVGAILVLFGYRKRLAGDKPEFKIQDWLSKGEWLDYNELLMYADIDGVYARIERHEKNAYERYQRANNF